MQATTCQRTSHYITSSNKLTSKNEIDDSTPDVVGAVAGEDNKHGHEEGSVPKVYAAHHKDPCPTDAAAGRPCSHVQNAFAPALHTMHLSSLSD